ncbi:MAG: N-acetyltransferase family protein [Planctomycetota bacterium]
MNEKLRTARREERNVPDEQQLLIRESNPVDAAAIAEIYNHYILNTLVTFETEAVTAEEIRNRMEGVSSLSLPWIIAEWEGEVAGYAYANRFHSRAAYAKTAETTVYLHPSHCGRGIGSRLYRRLLDLVSLTPIHTVIGAIALPNEPSEQLHERLGFKKVGHFHEVGLKFDKRIDVGFWQRMDSRRSLRRS